MASKYLLCFFLLGAILNAVSARRQRKEGDPCTGSWRDLGAYCLSHKGKFVYEDVIDKACIENSGWEYDINNVVTEYVHCIREGFAFDTKEECDRQCVTNYG